MSSKVKQANFRLPLEYMDLIDEFARREGITKAAVITRALDSLKASYASGAPAAAPAQTPSAGVSDAEISELKNKLAQAQAAAEEATRQLDAANSRATAAEQARDAAEARARQFQSKADSAMSAAASDEEVKRLKRLVENQKRMLDESSTSKDAALAAKDAAIAERDAKINSLTEKLGAANAKAELALKEMNVEAVPIADSSSMDGDPTKALAMLNMIGGVMSAFQAQVDDARAVGEQEGRKAVQREFQEMVEKARTDGYRDAMSYLDDRVSTARETGAREERARIANMGFFERNRYLRMHIA